jgi:hypothetical protein
MVLSYILDFLKYILRKYRLSIASHDSIYLACSRSHQRFPEYYKKNSEAKIAEEERSKLEYLNVKSRGVGAMPYNRDIGQKAPFPSGALPTHEELNGIIRRANEARARAVVQRIGRLFRSK